MARFYRTILLPAILCLAFSLNAFSQSDSLKTSGGVGKVTGTAIDSTTGLPLISALVKLQEINDQLLKYTETDENGSFAFDSIPHGIYEVQIVKDTYEPLSKTIDVNSPLKDIGTLYLSKSITTEEITVEAQKPFMEIKDDKKIFNIENNILTQGKTAIDVLKTLPLVNVDAQDNIMLRGDSRIKILINGKENRVYANLRQIPADIIEKIELITTPSAKYEAEGVTGIINVILKKDKDSGYTGTLSLGGSTIDTYNSYGNFNFKASKFTFFSNLGVGTYKNVITNDSKREDFLYNPSVLTTNSTGNNKGNYLFGSQGAEYDLSEKSVIGTDFSINRYDGNNITDVTQQFMSDSLNYTDLFKNHSNYNGLSLNASLYFNNKFDSTGRELNFDLSYGKNDWKTKYKQEKLTSPLSLTNDNRDQISNTVTGQIDYIHPFSETVKMETGYKGSFEFNDNSLYSDSLDHNTNTFIELNKSQDFDYDNFINGFYMTMSKNFGAVSTKVGGRVEYTRTSFGPGSDNRTVRQYTDFFPSASLTYKLGGGFTSFQLSYSRRITRPSMWYLNPFVYVYNSQSISTGNPDLTPEYTNSIELAFNTFLGGLSISPDIYYKKTTDVITRYSYLTDTNTTVSTYNNSSELSSYGTDLVLGGQLFNFITFNASIGISRMNFSGTPGASLDNEGTSYSGNAYLSLPIGSLATLEMYYYRWGDRVTAQGTNRGKNYLTLGISKMFMDNKLRVNLNVNDVLANTGHPESYTNGVGYTQSYVNDFKQQSVSIYVSYSFGNTDKPQQKRRKKKTEQPQQPPEGN
ncbi:MAG: TonB-dependent receptor [Ignavibacteriae bacterium]|nr:TonB-dependent receptor [Ignavibacteriota bacterium]MCB9244763.1 TonB-dependent receptor [Ignavibacteriales bacterium]